MNKNEILRINVEDYAYEGKGIARVPDKEGSKKFVVFIDRTYPGDEVEAKIIKVKKKFAIAKLINIYKASGDRVPPRCKYFGVCGGCKQQDLSYEKQIFFKQKQVKDIFERLGGLGNFEINSIIPSKLIFNYRNKMEFSFSEKRWLTKEEIEQNNQIKDRNFALGLHIPKIFDKVLDIEECFLHPEINNKILNFTREFFKIREISIFSTKTHEGFLRNLVLKNSSKTNDLMVNLVTSENLPEIMKQYAGELVKFVPQVTTIVNNISKKKSQVAIGDYEIVYYGQGFIFDYIGKYKFRISANSFFQTNTMQANTLYQIALNKANLNGEEIVYDLYSGAGTITIYFSKLVKRIYGFESVKSATEDAIYNAELNGVNNVHFINADLNKSFLPIINELKLPEPTVIIADPPRSGMNPKTVRDILKLSPKKIIYISCNPTTQARDIKMIVDSGNYSLKEITPVDMFPHTFHIENVALLEKK